MSPSTTKRSLLIRAGLVGFAGLAAFSGGNVARAVHEDLEFPAAIHAGTCAEPGDEVVALDNLVRLPVGSAGEEEDRVGAPGSQVVHGLDDDADASIDLTIDDLFAEDHVLAVFNPDGDIIACGPVGAYSYEDGDDLFIGLRSQGESPYSGVAIFDGDDADEGDDDADDEDLDVEVYLVNNTPAPTADADATPVADDDDAADDGDDDSDGDDATPEA